MCVRVLLFFCSVDHNCAVNTVTVKPLIQDDVDMKEGGGDMGTDATRGSHRGALGTTAAVGPLPVGGGVSQRSGGHAGDDPGNPRPGDRDPDDDAISGQEEGIDGHHHPHHRHHRRGRGVSGGAAVGAEGHGDVDDDETCLGSFGMLGVPTAPIGDFSPQFKFSFTDDIHLDLGGGLKVRWRAWRGGGGRVPICWGVLRNAVNVAQRDQSFFTKATVSWTMLQ